MLHTSAPFPFPGSHARLDGRIWRIHQHNPDGTATLLREDAGGIVAGSASAVRRAALGDLVDPASDDPDAAGLGPRGRAQLAWLRARLRTANAVLFVSLKDDVAAAAARGEVPIADGPAIAGLLRRLGWERQSEPSAQGLTIWRRWRAPAVPA